MHVYIQVQNLFVYTKKTSDNLSLTSIKHTVGV